jgi:hypothetical protein
MVSRDTIEANRQRKATVSGMGLHMKIFFGKLWGSVAYRLRFMSMPSPDSKDRANIPTHPPEIRGLIFRKLCGTLKPNDGPASQQKPFMINIPRTCRISRHEALTVFLNFAAFEVSSQRTVDSLAAVIGDYGSVS